MKRTAGEKAYEASKDSNKYTSGDLADGLIKDVSEQIVICAENHITLFKDLSEFCVVNLTVGDPLIKNAIRHKYFALPWLPKPRPDQSCFLFNVKTQKFKHLWSLPNAQTMAELDCLTTVHKKYERMRKWCVAFYEYNFWELIRDMNSIDLLSEEEMIDKKPDQYKKLMKLLAKRMGYEKREKGYDERK